MTPDELVEQVLDYYALIESDDDRLTTRYGFLVQLANGIRGTICADAADAGTLTIEDLSQGEFEALFQERVEAFQGVERNGEVSYC